MSRTAITLLVPLTFSIRRSIQPNRVHFVQLWVPPEMYGSLGESECARPKYNECWAYRSFPRGRRGAGDCPFPSSPGRSQSGLESQLVAFLLRKVLLPA